MLHISTGFLSGNLFSDETGIDTGASTQRYAELLNDALLTAYPDAEVIVDYQHAVGSLPRTLRTQVWDDIDETNETDADLAAIAERVDQIAADVFEGGAWYVELSEAVEA